MRRSPRHILVATVATAIVVVAGCNTTAPADPTRTDTPPPVPAGVPDQAGCNPARMATCALPFPSDPAFTVADPTTATGRRVTIGDSAVNAKALRGLRRPVRPTQVFAGADGFSPAGPILFEVDRTPVAASLTDAAVVVDLDTGAVVPVRAEIDPESERRGGHVVRIWPRSRFEFGHRYAAALTTEAYATDGVGYAPSPGMRKALWSARYAEAVDALAKQNVSRSAIIAATFFTVRSDANAKERFRAAAAAATNRTPSVRNVTAGPNVLLNGVGALVTGQVQLPDFRTTDGGFRPEQAGRDTWIDFVLAVPQSAANAPAPVVVYGHPITYDKGLFILVAAINAQRGAATIAIDYPHHGSRAIPDGGDFDSLMNPDGVARLISGMQQGVIDTIGLVSAVKKSLTTLDAVPFNPLDPTKGDGKADLDTTRVLYEGTSLGGVFGMTTVALDPRISAGAYQVSGAALLQLITNSERWEKNFGEYDQLGFRDTLPKGATGGEAAFFIATVQQAMDGIDAVGWADELRTRPMLMINVYQDRTVPNGSTQAIAEAAKVPVVGNEIWDIAGVPRYNKEPRNGRYMVQVDTRDWMQILRDEFGHFGFITEPATVALDRWLGNQLR